MKQQYKRKKEPSFVYGFHSVKALLTYQSLRAKKLFVARKKDAEQIIKLANGFENRTNPNYP